MKKLTENLLIILLIILVAYIATLVTNMKDNKLTLIQNEILTFLFYSIGLTKLIYFISLWIPEKQL